MEDAWHGFEVEIGCVQCSAPASAGAGDGSSRASSFPSNVRNVKAFFSVKRATFAPGVPLPGAA